MLEDFVEAERVYMHVVQSSPFDPSSYLNLGLCRCLQIVFYGCVYAIYAVARAKARDFDGAGECINLDSTVF